MGRSTSESSSSNEWYAKLLKNASMPFGWNGGKGIRSTPPQLPQPRGRRFWPATKLRQKQSGVSSSRDIRPVRTLTKRRVEREQSRSSFVLEDDSHLPKTTPEPYDPEHPTLAVTLSRGPRAPTVGAVMGASGKTSQSSKPSKNCGGYTQVRRAPSSRSS